MDKGQNRTLELRATTSVNGHWAECLPEDLLADVGGNEEGDTGAETVALLEELIEEDNNETGDNELDNEQDADTKTKLRWRTVETADDIDTCLAEAHKHSQELLSSLVELPVALKIHVDIDQARAYRISCQDLFMHANYMYISTYADGRDSMHRSSARRAILGRTHVCVGGAQFQRMLDVTLQTDQQLFFDRSARLYSQPAMSWKTMPEVMIGVIPNSMRVPLFEAIIALSQ